METWIQFSRLTEDMDLSDTIEAFFEYAEEFEGDAVVEGIKHFAKDGEEVLALLISMEIMLAELSDSECEKVDPSFFIAN